MARVVVVSNRVADLRKPAAGGLAVAVGQSLRQSGGLWFGWSGETLPLPSDAGTRRVRRQRMGAATVATIALSPDEVRDYYLGYSNTVLWPVFHYRLDLADFDGGHFTRYRQVNRLFAQHLLPLLLDDDLVWVHDYHLIPLAEELRALGSQHRIGFFLHIPLPPPQIVAAIPEHQELMRALFSYDLVGVQSAADADNLARYLDQEQRVRATSDGVYLGFGRQMRVAAFPIGIDVEEFEKLVAGAQAQQTLRTLREQYARRELLIGVDRLDYSKGLPQRLRAFRRLLERFDETRERATLIQIAAPTREGLDAYDDLKRELERLCGAINGDFGGLEWMPVRYLHRTVARQRLPGLYRAARVALVTPLRDGMNLVAKEFVVAQDPADPGVLVLSRFAGAAEQLGDAVLVNPYATEQTAEAILQALRMPLDERQKRHEGLLRTVRAYDVHWWQRSFLDALRTGV